MIQIQLLQKFTSLYNDIFHLAIQRGYAQNGDPRVPVCYTRVLRTIPQVGLRMNDPDGMVVSWQQGSGKLGMYISTTKQFINNCVSQIYSKQEQFLNNGVYQFHSKTGTIYKDLCFPKQTKLFQTISNLRKRMFPNKDSTKLNKSYRRNPNSIHNRISQQLYRRILNSSYSRISRQGILNKYQEGLSTG